MMVDIQNWKLSIEQPVRARRKEPAKWADHVVDDVYRRFKTRFDISRHHVTVHGGPGRHRGLGSHTSLAMATTVLLSHYHDLNLTNAEKIELSGRGGTSGIGVHGALLGGLIMDEGRKFPEQKRTFAPSSQSRPLGHPHLKNRWQLPRNWRVVIVANPGRGLSNQAEKDFFLQHCPIPRSETNSILRLSEQFSRDFGATDLDLLDDYLLNLQQLGLKRREWEIQPPASQALRDAWQRLRDIESGLPTLALSSLGPTLFLITEQAERVVSQLRSIGVPPTLLRTATISMRGVEVTT